MPTATTSKTSTRKSPSKSSRKSPRKTAKGKSVTKQSASATIKEVASSCHVSYRKARRIARDLDLGVGKGARYDSLNKRQVAKLVKTLSA